MFAVTLSSHDNLSLVTFTAMAVGIPSRIRSPNSLMLTCIGDYTTTNDLGGGTMWTIAQGVPGVDRKRNGVVVIVGGEAAYHYHHTVPPPIYISTCPR
eukprot:gene4372-biopygen12566